MFCTSCVSFLCWLLMLSRIHALVLPKRSWLGATRSYHLSLAVSGKSTATDASATKSAGSSRPVPITVLSGFLGAGKTTFLSDTLSKRAGTKFGLVVNDMATVNVDAKQIRQQTMDPFGGIDTMELQDGCVCCTLAEDLVASVSKLITLSDMKGEQYEHIVVECSGIAEPRKIRDLFQQAEDYKLDIMKKVRLDTLITLVDATVFLNMFGTDQALGSNKHLAYRDKGNLPPTDPNDQNTYTYLDGNEQRKITDLLLEQVECADIVMINKCDLLKSPDEIELVKKVVASINPMAKVVTTVYGAVPNPLSLIGSAGAKGAADWGILDEHRKLLEAVEEHGKANQHEDHHHEHEHDHHVGDACTLKDCQDPTHHHHDHHHHDHHHDHVSHGGLTAATDCHDASCTDPSHHHHHGHAHSAVDCHDATCTDPSHHHEHSHSHSHDHGHEHGHVHKNADMTTAEKFFGITSFVYRRRRPFHPVRFSMFLQSLGKLSVNGVIDMTRSSAPAGSSATGDKEGEQLTRAKRALLRSKGFVWMGTSAQAAYFMSHAGQYLELVVLGRWWAAIDKAQWPQQAQEDITVDFDGPHGDRRQEVVFIGQFAKDGGTSQRALEKVLDECLLTDTEMEDYEVFAKMGDDALKDHFAPQFK